jgi:tetratricopeptide (TPR) repeat protein
MIRRQHTQLIIKSFAIFILIFSSASADAQEEKKYIRKGNKDYSKDNFPESEVQYRKASEENPASPAATFNIGDALYRQNKFDDAGKQFIDNANQVEDAAIKAASMYNLGNSLLQSNKVKESIEAYKNSLKLNPESVEAKYNLGYAQNLLKLQEQQQQQQQQQQQKDQENQQNSEDNKNQEKNEDQQNAQNQNDQQKQQEQEQQQEEGISKEDAERLLNALANDEKNVQEKVKRDKAAKSRTRSLKNW